MLVKYVPVTGSVQTTISQVHGWSFAENAGTPAAARVLLRDGGATGAVLADIRLAASDSKAEGFPSPVLATGTVYVEVAAGTVRGALYGV